MADDGDNGGDGGDGGMLEDNAPALETGYPTPDSWGNSETGVLSHPNIAASGSFSYTNVGTPGYQTIDESGDKNRNAQRMYNQGIKGGAFTPMPDVKPFQSAYPAGYQPGLDTGLQGHGGGTQSMMPQEKPPEKPQEEKKPGGAMSKGSTAPAPDWMTGKGSPDYRVQRNPYPFTPVVPVAGSGVKKTFFEAQQELLKAMMPGWIAQGKR
jgi:hypothetical protein